MSDNKLSAEGDDEVIVIDQVAKSRKRPPLKSPRQPAKKCFIQSCSSQGLKRNRLVQACDDLSLVCDNCWMRFYRLADLNRHFGENRCRRSDTLGGRNSVAKRCGLCMNRFSTSKDFFLHIEVGHGIGSAEAFKEKLESVTLMFLNDVDDIFICRICGWETDDPETRLRHHDRHREIRDLQDSPDGLPNRLSPNPSEATSDPSTLSSSSPAANREPSEPVRISSTPRAPVANSDHLVEDLTDSSRSASVNGARQAAKVEAGFEGGPATNGSGSPATSPSEEAPAVKFETQKIPLLILPQNYQIIAADNCAGNRVFKIFYKRNCSTHSTGLSRPAQSATSAISRKTTPGNLECDRDP